MKQFVLEVFVSRSNGRELVRAERRLTAAAGRVSRNGTPVRYLRATYVPEDETCFHVLEADSADLVARVSKLAALDGGRILEARTIEAGQNGRTERRRPRRVPPGSDTERNTGKEESCTRQR
jgi:hypothetical protein